LFQEAIQGGYYGMVKIMLEGHELIPTREDIALAKIQWQRTQDPVYQKIGRILVAYYGPWNFLLQQAATLFADYFNVYLTEDLLELIYSFAAEQGNKYRASISSTQERFQQAIEKGYYKIVNIMLKTHKLHPTKESIVLAKAQWVKTQNPIYKKIGRILTHYYGPQNFLLQQIGTSQETGQLPKEIIDLIISFVPQEQTITTDFSYEFMCLLNWDDEA
jgi:hypothetical protein